jgi:hypothetical protein
MTSQAYQDVAVYGTTNDRLACHFIKEQVIHQLLEGNLVNHVALLPSRIVRMLILILING